MKALCCLLLGLAGLAPLAQAQAPSATPGLQAPDYALRARAIAQDTWVIEGAVADFAKSNGCNIINTGFIGTPAGVLVINTGVSQHYGRQQRALIERTVAQATPAKVVNLNLHPDYFLGNQAWAGVPTQALAGSIQGMRAEGKAYEDNLYRLCGDWMQDTVATPAGEALAPGRAVWGGHDLEWRRWQGHTGDDLVLIDHSTGVVFTGGLVFRDRVPTAPHADLVAWQRSLHELQAVVNALPQRQLVPSHGPVHPDDSGIRQTLDWLQWLEATLQHSAAQGLDLGEVLRLPLPARFAAWAAQPAEYVRSVTYLYPRYEQAALNTATPD